MDGAPRRCALPWAYGGDHPGRSDAIGTVGVARRRSRRFTLFTTASVSTARSRRRHQASFKLGIDFRIGSAPAIPTACVRHCRPSSGSRPFRQLGRAPDGDRAGELALQLQRNCSTAAGWPGPRAAGRIPDLTYAYHFDASLLAAFLALRSARRCPYRGDDRLGSTAMVRAGTFGVEVMVAGASRRFVHRLHGVSLSFAR